MDQTALFRASLQAICLRDPSLSCAFTTSLTKSSKCSSDGLNVQQRAVQLARTIRQLAEILQQQQGAYIRVSDGILADSGALNDAQKREFDDGAQNIINTCSQLIKKFRQDYVIAADKVLLSDQWALHCGAVADILNSYFNAVCIFYTEMKRARNKRTYDCNSLLLVKPSQIPLAIEERTNASKKNDESSGVCSLSLSGNSRFSVASDDSIVQLSAKSDDDILSSRELQIFEAENELMFNELNNLTEEVRLVERKVVQVSQLQELFAEKVLQQDKDIDRIADLVVGGTENVAQANDELRKAIKTNAGMRVWVLLFLLVMSFTILFLDWYKG